MMILRIFMIIIYLHLIFLEATGQPQNNSAAGDDSKQKNVTTNTTPVNNTEGATSTTGTHNNTGGATSTTGTHYKPTEAPPPPKNAGNSNFFSRFSSLTGTVLYMFIILIVIGTCF